METVWLTQAQMAELFQKDQSNIARHIRNVFDEGELMEDSNMQILHNTLSKYKPTKIYSLDVIISVGYRVTLENEELFVACNQLATNASEYVKELILSLNTQCLSKQELQLATRLVTKSRQYFERVAFKPAQSLGLIEPVVGDPVHSPKTVYRLTKLGLALCEKLRENLPSIRVLLRKRR